MDDPCQFPKQMADERNQKFPKRMHSGFNHPTASNASWSRFRPNNTYNPIYIKRSSYNDQGGIEHFAIGGHHYNMPSSEQYYVRQRNPYGETYPNSCFRSANSVCINRSIGGQINTQCKTPGKEQYRLPPVPPRTYSGMENGVFHDNVPSNLLEHASERVQTSQRTLAIQRSHKFLTSYAIHRRKFGCDSRSLPKFLDRLHLVVCKDGNCKCTTHRNLICHFDKCGSTECGLCGPIYELCGYKNTGSSPLSVSCSAGNCSSGSVGTNTYFAGGLHHFSGYVHLRDSSDHEVELPAKRTKADNVAQHNNWSLSDVHVQKFSSGLIEQNTFFPEDRNCIDQRVEPITKPVELENVAQYDDWSLHAIVYPMLVKMDGDVLIEGNKKKEVFGVGEATTSVLEKTCTIDNGGPPPDKQLSIGTSKVKQLDSNEICVVEEWFAAEIENDSLVTETKIDNGGPPPDIQLKTNSIRTSKVKQLDSNEICVVEEWFAAESENDSLVADTKIDTCQSGKALEDSKDPSVCLTDFLSNEQIKEHLHSLNPCINMESKGNVTADEVVSNTCQLCAKDGLMFPARPLYCSTCQSLIKLGKTYYSPDGMDKQYCFCTTCFKTAHGGRISSGEDSFSKTELKRVTHTEEAEEAWVQCDKCQRWQHQICGLYNQIQDVEGKAKYICPICRLSSMKMEASSKPQVCGAQDLPRTKLSDHIEQRLLRSLEQERKQRSELIKKPFEEVPGAQNLTVRVVLAANKQVKVKQQFLDILHGETYPTEFPYRSKVIFLFQKVEGVDVCLFAMFVQEYGSDCEHPNKRAVYISYLDSVKYFKPEIKAATGVALRTFVYHEILIGYLDYCKLRGFMTCYIWACPPTQDDDYILYCHPETQKRQNLQKLLSWYKKMIKKAVEENVVMEYTDFHDYFFIPKEEHHCKITAARLPYFEGDYCSGAIENIAQTLDKESMDSNNILKQMSKRTLKAMGFSDLSVDTAKHALVMQKLGDRIMSEKKSFFVLQLQSTCKECRRPILPGNRWDCNVCSKFHLCSRCVGLKHFRRGKEAHATPQGEKHPLHQIPLKAATADTEDHDALLENDLFDSRHSFLDFCIKNVYQFGTLRHAKHSSMVILHHLKMKTRNTHLQQLSSECGRELSLQETLPEVGKLMGPSMLENHYPVNS